MTEKETNGNKSSKNNKPNFLIIINILQFGLIIYLWSEVNAHSHDYEFADKNHSHSYANNYHSHSYADEYHSHSYADEYHSHNLGFNAYAKEDHSHSAYEIIGIEDHSHYGYASSYHTHY